MIKTDNIKQHSLWLKLFVFVGSFVLFFVIFGNVYKVISKPVGWEEELPFTDSSIEVNSYHIAEKGNLLVLAFHGRYKKKQGVFTITSYNEGESFFEPHLISEIPADEEAGLLHPRVAISDKGEISVVWQYFEEGTSLYRIYSCESEDKGQTWSKPVIPFTPSDMEILPLNFFDDKNRLHILYHALKDQEFYIYHTFQNKKKEFIKPVLISSKEINVRGAFFPAALTDGKKLYIVWQGKDNQPPLTDNLYFTSSANYGTSFKESYAITYDASDDSAPSMIQHNGIIYLVYQNNKNTNWEVFLQRGMGEKEILWTEEPIKISDTNVNCYQPFISLSRSGKVTVVWSQPDSGVNRIVESVFNPDSQSFSTPLTLTQNTESASWPLISSSESQMNTYWIEKKRIFTKKSDIYTAPPKVYSKTHPYGTWSQFGTAELFWTSEDDSSGIAGYATIVNKEKYFDPTVQNIDGAVNESRVPFLSDGISYFHIRAIDKAGNYSRTIHFPLLVSSTPISIPTISSPTHEEAKQSKEHNAKFLWKNTEKERIKGYYYSFSRDSVEVPKDFTDKNSMAFNDLKDGRYFFSVRAVDKTDTPGRIATYEIVIGETKKLTDKDYDKLAAALEEKDKKPVTAGTAVKANTGTTVALANTKEESTVTQDLHPLTEDPDESLFPVETVIYLDQTTELAKTNILSFSVELKSDAEFMKELIPQRFNYSVYKGSEKVRSGYSYDGTINIKNLRNEEYTFEVQGLYALKDNPRGKVYSTDVSRKKSLIIQNLWVPVDDFYDIILSNLALNWHLTTTFFFALSSSLLFSFGFFKFYYTLRAEVIRLIQRIMLLFHSI
jgi:hypothetical protein